MGAAERFSRHEVQRILDVTEKQLDYWERLRIVAPRKGKGEKFYEFRDLISLRTAKQLIEQGVPANRLRRSLAALQQKLAEVQAPLTELRILSDGKDIVVERDGARMEPLSGQFVLNFDTRQLKDKVRVMPERNAAEWFALALQYEADRNTWAEAMDAYEHALAIDPQLVEALINLGTLHYEQGDFEKAAESFRRAVELDPENALAQFNLGSLLEELGQLEPARGHLRQAVRLDPSYADAHYNLAFVCEKLGAYAEARQHWQRYVELDPSSPWCTYARQRLAKRRP
jgi:tetratricopeptide (TPR) repeat protein